MTMTTTTTTTTMTMTMTTKTMTMTMTMMIIIYLKAGVFELRCEGCRSSDEEHGSDVERLGDEQVVGRGKGHLRCGQGQAHGPRRRHEAVFEMGRHRTGGRSIGRRSEGSTHSSMRLVRLIWDTACIGAM